MRCPKCGFDNNEHAKTCAKCGAFIDPSDEAKKRHRKVVQLPSNQSADETVPIDSQKVSRATADETTPIDQQQVIRAAQRKAHEATSGSKSPTPRRRSGSTGKIPALKHPAHEDGKIPAEERTSTSSAAHAQRPANRQRTTQTIIDDAVLAAESATQVHAAVPARSRDQASASKRPSINDDNRTNRQQRTTKTLIITIAIIIVIFLVALGMFFASTGVDDRTIRFDTDGGTLIGNQYVEPDSELSRPANPTRPGYEFDGWYLDANFSEAAEFPLMVTQNMTLYAKWKQETTTSTMPGGVPSTITESEEEPEEDILSPDEEAYDEDASGPDAEYDDDGASAPSVGPSAGGSSSSGSGVAKPSTKPSTGGSSSGNSGGSNSSPNDVNSNPASNGKVQITLTASNGAKLTGTVTLHNGYVIPDSSKKAYTIAELKALKLNAAEMCIARNEIYARAGYSFRCSGLQSYFNARSWYHNKGWRGEFPKNSAAYITAHNLLELEKQNPETAKWTSLLHK